MGTSQLAISDIDAKILWGRAAGICSNPACRADLTEILLGDDSYHIGEMAHVVARNEAGPRGTEGGGSDKYANLVLLCPTCHRRVDKAPNQFPEEMLFAWKAEHEEQIRSRGKEEVYSNWPDLKSRVRWLLNENRRLWKSLGPKSLVAQADPNSNLATVWERRKLDTIVPNNRLIINAIEGNRALIPAEAVDPYLEFKIHATSFEQHQYERMKDYPLFPAHFDEVFQ